MAKKKKESPQDKLINLQAQQLAAQVANWAAQLEFQKQRLQLLELPEMQGKAQIDIDRLAFDKAEAEWGRAFKEASVTGTYNGQPTIEWLTQQAQMTGVLNGQQTLQGRLTDAQINQMNQQMKLANDEFISQTTGYYNGQKTFDREKFEAAQASDAWKFLATLTGPANAFKQARAIGSMPGGLRDLMGAWAGQYALPSSTSVGSGGRASLGGLLEGAGGESSGTQFMPSGGSYASPVQQTNQVDIGKVPGRGFTTDKWTDATKVAAAAWNTAHPGYEADGSTLGYHAIQPPYPNSTTPPAQTQPAFTTQATDGSGGSRTAAASPAYSYEPPGVQADATAWNYAPTAAGSTSVYPPGVAAPADSPTVSTVQAMSAPNASVMYRYGGVAITPSDANLYGASVAQAPAADAMNAGTANTSGTLLPNQINARNYQNTPDYAKELGWASFEDQGWDKALAQETYQRSLPKYTGPKAGSFAF